MDHKEKFDKFIEELEREAESMKEELKKGTGGLNRELLNRLVGEGVKVPRGEYRYLRDVYRTVLILWKKTKKSDYSVEKEFIEDLFSDLMEG